MFSGQVVEKTVQPSEVEKHKSGAEDYPPPGKPTEWREETTTKQSSPVPLQYCYRDSNGRIKFAARDETKASTQLQLLRVITFVVVGGY